MENDINMDDDSQVGVQLLQKLPNECLLLIINELQSDIHALYGLLTVNRFFFQESLKLLIGLLLKRWSLPYNRRGFKKKEARELVLALVFRSVVMHEWLKHYGMVDAASPAIRRFLRFSEGDDFFIDLESKVLRKYGLCFPCSSFQPDGSFKRLTMVDYSAYVTSLSTSDIGRVDLDQIIQLWKPNKSRPWPLTGLETSEEQTDTEKTRVARALVRLLLQHNYQHITHLEFSLHESVYYVQYAAKMPRLKTMGICVTKSRIEHLKFSLKAAEFIRLNQETFPSKPRLDIKFLTSKSVSKLPVFGSGGTAHEGWMARRRSWSETNLPLRMLYEAIGRPRSINASLIPFFYEEPLSIETENIVSLVDHDVNRWNAGECPAVEKFLRRCHELRSLDIVVGPSLFVLLNNSPTIANQTDSSLTPKGLQQPLAKLSDLKLRSVQNSRTILQELNSIIALSRNTLETISVMKKQTDGPFAGRPMEIDLMRDLQELLSNREASFVGLDWHLPKLREIKLSFEGSIMIGTFDQCPLLESLWIESDTTDFQYSGYYSSMSAIHWKAYSSLLSLLPIWNLPRLEKLHLSGLPSALFNFESIRSMGRLKELVLDMNIRGWASGFADMYMKLYADILESSFRKRVNAPGQDSVPRFHPWNWSSESLSSIFIKGPAAFMFHLEQLVQFPSLERLELAPPTNDTYSFMNKEDDVLGMLYSCNTLDPLDSSFDMGKIMDRVDPPLPLSKTWTQTQPGEPATLPRVRIQDGKDVYGLSTSRFIRLSSASKLRTVRFSGRWDALGPNSWMQVLTNYAPNISELHGFSTVDPIGQIRGIELAFTAMKKMNSIYDRVKGEMKQASDGLHSNDVCRQGRKPRSGLHAVFTTGVLSEVDQMKLGLEMIVESDVEYYAARPNGRIYEFRQDQSFFVPT